MSSNLAFLERYRKRTIKREFIIEKKKAAILCNTVNVVQTPLPFYATQIIKLFLNSRISANHDNGGGF